MSTSGTTIDPSRNGLAAVPERLRELVQALRVAPAIARFRAAEERFRGDEDVRALQARVRACHEQLQRAERANRHDPRLFQDAREAQALLQGHPAVAEFVASRQDAMDLLRDVNEAMTEVLGVDLGGSVRRACAC
ncbi:MAG: YlbF family regulator [Trueperaceae bacterium]|nr:YlbF family regulator [Trueperaceae bacterium]